MSDLIERLRASAEVLTEAADNPDFPAAYLNPAWDYAGEAEEAAARIASLEAEVARLREALGRIAVANPDRLNAATARQATNATGAIARAALAAPDTGGTADGEWACRGGTKLHCHVFCTCDGSKVKDIDPRL